MRAAGCSTIVSPAGRSSRQPDEAVSSDLAQWQDGHGVAPKPRTDLHQGFGFDWLVEIIGRRRRCELKSPEH